MLMLMLLLLPAADDLCEVKWYDADVDVDVDDNDGDDEFFFQLFLLAISLIRNENILRMY